MASIIPLLLSAFAASATASVQDPKIAPRPPMGYNNWARFQCNLNETLFVKTADAMVEKGLLAAGYNTINLDDCWPLQDRSAKGELQWNATIFPHGMPWLGDYLHGKGFNFGIYTNAGNMTCGWYPGSQDYEEIDALTFQSWGVDYLKLDACHVNLESGRSNYQEFAYRYHLWHEILTTKLRKPLIFSQSAPAYFSPNFHLDLNNTGWYETMEYVPTTGELARHSDDIKVYGNNPTNTFEPGGHWESMMNNYAMQIRLARYQKCGFYNDPDFLIVDWPDLSLDEKKTHFTLWASFSAPLIISAYIPDLTDEEVAYLTNKEVIAVDQDALCEQGTVVSQDGYFDVLTKNLANGDRLLTVMNRGNETNTTEIGIERLGISLDLDSDSDSSAETETEAVSGILYKAKDLWTNTTHPFHTSLTITLRSRQTAIYRIAPAAKGESMEITPTGQIFNTFSMNCLAATRHSSVTFTACNGADAQVWTINSSGSISPLSAPKKCLVVDSGEVGLDTCDNGDKTQLWKYGINGNLVNKSRGLCLEESEDGVLAKKCGKWLDSQVVALPGGVKLE